MCYLTRSLITKTGESPSTVNRRVRALYGVLKPLDVDFPGQLQVLVERADRLERDRSLSWYTGQIRKDILTLRHELTKARSAADHPAPEKAVPVAVGAVMGSLFPELVR